MFKSQQSLCLSPGPGYLTVHDSQGPRGVMHIPRHVSNLVDASYSTML